MSDGGGTRSGRGNASREPADPAKGGPWAVRLAPADATAAAALRLRSGIEASEAGGAVWLRGRSLDPALDLALRMLPGALRFALSEDGRLTPLGARVPTARLPEDARWKPLDAWAAPEPQPAALPGTPPERAPLRLIRGGGEREPAVLVAGLDRFAAWAERAPAARLRPLAFAASRDRRAVVRGIPLPPIPGARHAEREGIAIPLGFELTPPLDPTALRALLGLAPGDLALFAPDGTHEHIPAASFVRATRSAARLTRERA